RRYRMHWFNFDSNAYPIDDGSFDSLKPLGPPARFADSLTTATNLLRARNVAPQRVLLVSDGNDFGQADPVETAQRLGLVIDTLAPAAAETTPSATIHITDVQC